MNLGIMEAGNVARNLLGRGATEVKIEKGRATGWRVSFTWGGLQYEFSSHEEYENFVAHLPSAVESSMPFYRATIDAIRRERARQIDTYGAFDSNPSQWVLLLMQEMGEVAQVARALAADPNTQYVMELRAELIQVAALAAGMAEAVQEWEIREGIA